MSLRMLVGPYFDTSLASGLQYQSSHCLQEPHVNRALFYFLASCHWGLMSRGLVYILVQQLALYVSKGPMLLQTSIVLELMFYMTLVYPQGGSCIEWTIVLSSLYTLGGPHVTNQSSLETLVLYPPGGSHVLTQTSLEYMNQSLGPCNVWPTSLSKGPLCYMHCIDKGSL